MTSFAVQQRQKGVSSMEAIQEISGIEAILKEGEGYFQVVCKSHHRPLVFTPEIVHNLLGMALEKFAMVILMRAGTMPDNHTFSDLLRELKAQIPVRPAIEAALLAMDEESDLCSLEIRKVHIPGPERMRELVEIGELLQAAARDALHNGNLFPLHLE
jgi:hypothetical protein